VRWWLGEGGGGIFTVLLARSQDQGFLGDAHTEHQ
jgi:hypothetical protein